MEGNYLITTDNWFVAPDGQHYKSAWGKVQILEDSLLGVKTNRNSTNWYAKIGGDDMEIIVAGCQIHYAVKCNECPSLKPYINEEIYQGKLLQHKELSRIYVAQEI